MNENISITLHISEIENIIDDLNFSSRKLNLKYKNQICLYLQKTL